MPVQRLDSGVVHGRGTGVYAVEDKVFVAVVQTAHEHEEPCFHVSRLEYY